MLMRKFVIIAAVVFVMFGCQRAENVDKAAQESSKNAEMAMVVSQAKAIEEENKRLNDTITAKDAEINRLTADIASEQALNAAMQLDIENIKKAKRNISFAAIVSVVLNVILIFFLIRAKKMPKLLALPEGREEKETEENDFSAKPVVPEEDRPQEEQVKPETSKPARKSRRTENVANKTINEKPRRRTKRAAKDIVETPDSEADVKPE